MAKRKIMMVAYTHYSTDARVIKEAVTAFAVDFEIDFTSEGLTMKRNYEWNCCLQSELSQPVISALNKQYFC